jgi:hypothetical protein
MIISAAPRYLRNEAIFNSRDENLRNLISQPPRLQQVSRGISCGRPYPTINGLRADSHTPYSRMDIPVTMYIEVFTSGYTEIGVLIERDNSLGIVIRSLVEPPLIVDFMGFVQSVYEQYLPFSPLVIFFSILNAKGVWLVTSNHTERESREKWERQHLELKEFYVDNISEERKLLTKEICDRLWQCFHRETCDLFDDAGTFRSPR